MDIELSQLDNPEGTPLYFVAVLNDKYLKAGTVETYNASNWSSYAVSMTLDSASGVYGADFPPAPSGRYIVSVYARSGSTPATTDAVWSVGEFYNPYSPSVVSGGGDFRSGAMAGLLNTPLAETVVYRDWQSGANAGAVYINHSIKAVVIRARAMGVRGDVLALSPDLQVIFANDATSGITTVNTNRDIITLAGDYGTTPTDYNIAEITQADGAAYMVRLT